MNTAGEAVVVPITRALDLRDERPLLANPRVRYLLRGLVLAELDHLARRIDVPFGTCSAAIFVARVAVEAAELDDTEENAERLDQILDTLRGLRRTADQLRTPGGKRA